MRLDLHILRYLLLAVLCLGPGGAMPAPASAAPQDIQKQLEAQMAGPAESIDLAAALLAVSRHWDPALDVEALGRTLDRMTGEAREALAGQSAPAEKVATLIRLVHRQWGFDYTEFVDAQGFPQNPSELFLHGLLMTRRGYCMNLSLIYLILADRLNLPLYGVALPNHFFVRYDAPGYRVNIESTDRGAALPDSYYRERFGVPEGTPYFMTRLDKKQTLGAYFSNVGLTFFRNRRMEEALFYMEQSVAVNPLSLDALNNLGNIYSEMKRFDDAIRSYRQALMADPGHPSTLFNLGIALTDAGRTGEAVESFLQVVQIQPDFLPAHRFLARLYLKEKNPIGALLHLKILGERQPQDFSTQINIGTVYLELEQYGLALEQFLATQRGFPGRLEVDERLAETYYRMNELDKAIVHYEHLVEKIPSLLQIYVQLGWTHYRKGNIVAALEWTERGLKAQPEETPFTELAHMNLGFYHVLLKHFDEAENWYGKVLKGADPKTEAAILGDLEEAMERFPDRPELDYFAGWICHRTGDAPRARAYLQKFLNRQAEGPLAERAREILGKRTSRTAAPENMVQIPAGFFIMGSDHHGDDESPQHQVFVSSFFIDKYEVSAARFAAFINTVDNPKKYYADSKRGLLVFDGSYHTRPGLENYPINNVSWYGADAFCRSIGKRLPTEAEWEKSARGTDGRLFPWGNDPISPERARYFQTWTEELQHGVMVPVDSMPEGQSPYGVFQLLGNVKEWVDDWYDREYYKDETHKANPNGPIGGEFKVLKGGSWTDLRSVIYASFRNNSYPDFKMDDYGFRCAFSEGEVPGGAPPGKLTSLETGITRAATDQSLDLEVPRQP